MQRALMLRPQRPLALTRASLPTRTVLAARSSLYQQRPLFASASRYATSSASTSSIGGSNPVDLANNSVREGSQQAGRGSLDDTTVASLDNQDLVNRANDMSMNGRRGSNLAGQPFKDELLDSKNKGVNSNINRAEDARDNSNNQQLDSALQSGNMTGQAAAAMGAGSDSNKMGTQQQGSGSFKSSQSTRDIVRDSGNVNAMSGASVKPYGSAMAGNSGTDSSNAGSLGSSATNSNLGSKTGFGQKNMTDDSGNALNNKEGDWTGSDVTAGLNADAAKKSSGSGRDPYGSSLEGNNNGANAPNKNTGESGGFKSSKPARAPKGYGGHAEKSDAINDSELTKPKSKKADKVMAESWEEGQSLSDVDNVKGRKSSGNSKSSNQDNLSDVVESNSRRSSSSSSSSGNMSNERQPSQLSNSENPTKKPSKERWEQDLLDSADQQAKNMKEDYLSSVKAKAGKKLDTSKTHSGGNYEKSSNGRPSGDLDAQS